MSNIIPYDLDYGHLGVLEYRRVSQDWAFASVPKASTYTPPVGTRLPITSRNYSTRSRPKRLYDGFAAMLSTRAEPDLQPASWIRLRTFLHEEWLHDEKTFWDLSRLMAFKATDGDAVFYATDEHCPKPARGVSGKYDQANMSIQLSRDYNNDMEKIVLGCHASFQISGLQEFPPEPLLQISVMVADDRAKKVLATRTNSTISLLELSPGGGESDTGLILRCVAAVKVSKFGMSDCVDFSINPSDCKQIAAIDSRGSWNIQSMAVSGSYECDDDDAALRHSYQELSRLRRSSSGGSWKRISWIAESSLIMVCTRSNLEVFSHDGALRATWNPSDRSQKIRIFDCCSSRAHGDVIFLLTSTQALAMRVIMGRTSVSTQIVSTWKHHRPQSALSMYAPLADAIVDSHFLAFRTPQDGRRIGSTMNESLLFLILSLAARIQQQATLGISAGSAPQHAKVHSRSSNHQCFAKKPREITLGQTWLRSGESGVLLEGALPIWNLPQAVHLRRGSSSTFAVSYELAYGSLKVPFSSSMQSLFDHGTDLKNAPAAHQPRNSKLVTGPLKTLGWSVRVGSPKVPATRAAVSSFKWPCLNSLRLLNIHQEVKITQIFYERLISNWLGPTSILFTGRARLSLESMCDHVAVSLSHASTASKGSQSCWTTEFKLRETQAEQNFAYSVHRSESSKPSHASSYTSHTLPRPAIYGAFERLRDFTNFYSLPATASGSAASLVKRWTFENPSAYGYSMPKSIEDTRDLTTPVQRIRLNSDDVDMISKHTKDYMILQERTRFSIPTEGLIHAQPAVHDKPITRIGAPVQLASSYQLGEKQSPRLPSTHVVQVPQNSSQDLSKSRSARFNPSTRLSYLAGSEDYSASQSEINRRSRGRRAGF